MTSAQRNGSGRSRLRAALGSLFAAVVVPVAAAAPAQAGPASTGPASTGALSSGALGASPLAGAAPKRPEPLTFGVQPSGPAKPDRRPNFTYSATPGARVTDYVAVSNISYQKLTLSLYAGDAFNTSDGGFDVLTNTAKSVDVGSWVKLETKTVTVRPRSKTIVSFRLSVPRRATPGDHAGGVVAALTTFRVDKKGNPIRVNQRVGARIYLRVSGPLHPQLTVAGMGAAYHGNYNPAGCGVVGVSYLVRNDGNTRLGGHQRLRVGGLFGLGAKTVDLADVPELLPGNALAVRTTVPCVLPTVRVTAAMTVDPVPPPGDVGPGAFSATVSHGLWALPWVLLGILVILAGLGLLYLRRRRERRQVPPGGPQAPTREPATAAAGPPPEES